MHPKTTPPSASRRGNGLSDRSDHLKINLGCGPDVRDGYVNVDARPFPGVECQDLSTIPWKWDDSVAEEIMMLDFLEHFSYRKTDSILQECWRVLKPGGKLVVQVPDFEECAKAVLIVTPFDCNNCEKVILQPALACPHCGHTHSASTDAALNRLYGGQDYDGNWHHTAFTKSRMRRYLQKNGFENFQELELVHQRVNWNFKMSAMKGEQRWD